MRWEHGQLTSSHRQVLRSDPTMLQVPALTSDLGCVLKAGRSHELPPPPASLHRLPPPFRPLPQLGTFNQAGEKNIFSQLRAPAAPPQLQWASPPLQRPQPQPFVFPPPAIPALSPDGSPPFPFLAGRVGRLPGTVRQLDRSTGAAAGASVGAGTGASTGGVGAVTGARARRESETERIARIMRGTLAYTYATAGAGRGEPGGTGSTSHHRHHAPVGSTGDPLRDTPESGILSVADLFPDSLLSSDSALGDNSSANE